MSTRCIILVIFDAEKDLNARANVLDELGRGDLT